MTKASYVGATALTSIFAALVLSTMGCEKTNAAPSPTPAPVENTQTAQAPRVEAMPEKIQLDPAAKLRFEMMADRITVPVEAATPSPVPVDERKIRQEAHLSGTVGPVAMPELTVDTKAGAQ